MDQRNCIKFQGHLKCWLWRLASLLWAEHKFNCGITGLRKAVKMSVASTTDKSIEALKKMFSDNRWITIREVADDIGMSFGLCQAIFTDVLGMKLAAPKIVPKLLNFEKKKTTSHGHRSGDVDNVQQRSRFAQKQTI